MTKFEQLVLRALHAGLHVLLKIAFANKVYHNSLAADVMADIEHEIVAAAQHAIDERDLSHG